MFHKILYMIILTCLLSACGAIPAQVSVSVPEEYDVELIFPSDSYPETALHIYGAIEQGYASICTIDRDGAERNRKESLAGIDTRDGYDRDEWPMAMCEEGGKGASVAYIDASDNRGAGSWVGHQLSNYPEGTRVFFVVEKPSNLFPERDEQQQPYEIYYANCTAAKAAGAAPLYIGDPGYREALDRDGDGIACES